MRFTIAIPAYKLRFFEECLDSIFAQSYQDFELLILNDASPEDFDSAIAKYSDKRIQYLKNDKNCGAINVVDNWNKLLKMSTGDYIVMMGDDDKLHPDFLSTFNSLIEKYPQVDVFHARVTGIDQKSSPCYLA
jgi:glycosyltransferase involved in cell wall biosynthesis